MLYNRMFSFVAVHLKHGQNKVKERNDMSGELIKQMQLHQIQSDIGGLENDQVADFAFFMGDLNYRLNTTFAELNNTNVMDDAIPMV